MIQADGLSLIRGGHHLLRDAQFTIFPGHRVGLVGANGAGKSSLFALLRGELKEDAGNLKIPPRWRMASVAQETPALDTPALAYVMQGDVEYTQVQRDLDAAERANDGEAIARCHGQLDAIGGYHIHARAAQLLIGLGFTQAQLEQPVRSFSGGWRMRLNLAQALISRADLLLLDEPTNHLDLDAIVWLEQWLKRFEGTSIVISHDREFLDGVVNQIIHIEHFQTQQYSGDYTSFQRQRSERRSQQQQQFDKEQAQRAHLQKFVDRFRAKASKAKQAQSRLKALEKLTSTAPLGDDEPYDLAFPEPGKLPNPLLQLDKIQAGYGDTTILERVQLNLVPGSRIGLLGRNGAGKSTLMKLLAGELSPQTGERAANAGLVIGYFAQHQLETLVLSDHAIAHLQRIDPRASEQSLRNFLGRFGFSGDRAYEAVAPFSGGEKARLVLALLIYQRPNLLLLDEPTNHLDLDMREALVMALQEFSGAMVIVSHDRHFLRATVDDYYLVANRAVEPFPGDLDAYSIWLNDQLKQLTENSEASANSTETPNHEGSAHNRKAQRQAAAQQRQALKPLRDKFKKTEQALEQLTTALQSVEAALADPAIYQKEQKDALTDLLKQQGELKARLEDIEATWLELSEQLEDMQ
ncbi:ATP-binding cassette domain-containing protein [Aliidiomarina sanyensis]|uniref:Probable ATP-binding protein YheS n=1 Tax=Aliidiomarina sanyensis TaxID=1249555 RepID=A0A432WPB2_9GAMM|nr:ATP-binding cassette domain-containing protein [Aliidiomarina sanyensis]RUO35624.1 ABC transporter ATP-binding protein [Aliidiomarina sanyensis]